uniref:Uncharacterized protein n=1 Tax=Morchella brunnea TaxID=1174671 RepID=A0A8K1MH94_9PEZI|nr:hypothetical protein LK370_mgp094 [Morchella brunnea]UBU98446.1 hypothetical protein [Morchella brunnea]
MRSWKHCIGIDYVFIGAASIPPEGEMPPSALRARRLCVYDHWSERVWVRSPFSSKILCKNWKGFPLPTPLTTHVGSATIGSELLVWVSAPLSYFLPCNYYYLCYYYKKNIKRWEGLL